MPTTTEYRHVPGEMAHGFALIAVLWVIHRLFSKDINALIEAVADRADRQVHIKADLPAVKLMTTYEAVPVEPVEGKAGDPLDEDPPDQPAPPWFDTLTHNGDGTPAFQPIDPTDTDWPDPDPIANRDRTAMIEPGTDLLAQIRATPNPANVPMPGLGGELVD